MDSFAKVKRTTDSSRQIKTIKSFKSSRLDKIQMILLQTKTSNSNVLKSNRRMRFTINRLTRISLIELSIVIISISFLFQTSLANNPQVVATKTTQLAPILSQQNENHQQQQRALEAELNSIVQQHDGSDADSKLLAEVIISRLMLDNLTGSPPIGEFNGEISELINDGDLMEQQGSELDAELVPFQQQQQQQSTLTGPTGPEAMKLKKLLNYLRNYESSISGSGGLNDGQAFVPFPALQAGQSATMKRAAIKMSNLLQQQQQQQRQLNSGYGARHQYDFGLGKRPDSGSVSGNVLRYGDSSFGVNGQGVGQFGKRPSAHRYDFGLGKRVASPAYPRYDFGLGKRAPNRIRYDFGLGK